MYNLKPKLTVFQFYVNQIFGADATKHRNFNFVFILPLKYAKPLKYRNFRNFQYCSAICCSDSLDKTAKQKDYLEFNSTLDIYFLVLRHFDVTIAEVSCSKNSAHNMWRFFDSEVRCFFVHILEGTTLYFFFAFLQECDQKTDNHQFM